MALLASTGKSRYGKHQRIFIRPFQVDRYGVLSGTVEFHNDEANDKPELGRLSLFTGALVGHDAGLRGMLCVGSNRAYDEASSRAIYTYQFEGFQLISPKPEEEQIEFEFDVTMQETPIETHPNFDAINARFGPFDMINRLWPRNIPSDTSQAGLRAANDPTRRATNPMFGVTSWLQPGVIYRRLYTRTDIPATVLAHIGEIVTPPEAKGFPGFSGFLAEGTRNWLKLAPKIRRRGSAVSIVEEYMLSGRHGARPEIYSAEALGAS